MLELDETTRRMLSRRYGPTPDAQARVLAGLRGTIGGPQGPQMGGGEGAPPIAGSASGSGQVVWIAKICAATTGLTGAGLLVLKLGASVLASSSDEREPNEVRANVEVPAPAREPPSATTAPEPATALDEPAPVNSTVPIQTPTKPRPNAAGSTLAAELALLDGAKRIQSSDPEAALARLDQHRQEFPTGVLAPEREALRVDVLCALGRMPAAKCGGTGSSKAGD